MELSNLNEKKVPLEKMPDCPKCGMDELIMVNHDQAACMFCTWISPAPKIEDYENADTRTD